MKLGSTHGRKVLATKARVNTWLLCVSKGAYFPQSSLVQVGDHYDSRVEIVILLNEGSM